MITFTISFKHITISATPKMRFFGNNYQSMSHIIHD